MTLKLNLSNLVPDDAQTMTISNLVSIAKEFGFDILERENRGTNALVFIPTYAWREIIGCADNKISIDLRSLVSVIIAEWNKENSPQDNVPTFWDNEINPFGIVTSYDPDIYTSSPVKEITVNTSAARQAAFASLASQNGNRITCIVKVMNLTGKYEIQSSSHEDLIAVGKTFNSTLIASRDLGSLWLIDCHLSQGTSGSVKIDGIEPFVKSPVTAAQPLPTIDTPVIVSTIDTPVTADATAATDNATADVADATADDQAAIDNAAYSIQNAAVTIELPTRSIPSPVLGLPKQITFDASAWQNDSGYYVSPNAQRVFETAARMLQADPYTAVKILMTGESGYGKTTIAQKMARLLGLGYFRMNCAAVRDPSEWFFDIEVKTVIVKTPDGYTAVPETIFTLSEFAERVASGNCVIVLDEFNRLESNMHNTLFPLLDDDGCTRLHHIDFRVGPNVLFVGTVNLGAKFSGTFLLDDALTNRFDMLLPVKPLPEQTEISVLQNRVGILDSTADVIVSLATVLRENGYDCSTRDTLKISKLVNAGMPTRDAFEFVIVSRIPDDESNAPVLKAVTDLTNRYLGERDAIFAAVPSRYTTGY